MEGGIPVSHQAPMGTFAPVPVSLHMAGMGNVAGSEPMDQSWVSMQGFGQNDWMLRFASDHEERS